MIHILHVVRPSAGGIRQHVIQLIKYMPADAVIHSIAAPASFLEDLPSELNIEMYCPLPIGKSTSFNDLKTSYQLAQIYRRLSNKTLIHAHGMRSGLIAALANVPFICTAHNLSKNDLLSSVIIRLIARKALTMVSVSPAVKNTLLMCGVIADKVVVLPNGVDIENFKTMPDNPTELSAKKNHDYVVGCIGRLSHEKGIDILIEAAKILPDISFLVAGDGPEKNKLISIAPNNVEFLGRIKDTRELLAVADVLVIPSREEGQGIVALEAMASHVPVIAACVGGLQTMLTNKQNALLVKPEAPNEIAEAIRFLKRERSLRDILTRNSYEMVLQNYDIHTTSKMVLSHYQQVFEKI